MGSVGIATWLSQLSFWGLLLYGCAVGELRLQSAAVFLLLWLGVLVGLPYVPYEPAHAMFSSFVAALDIVVVFMIFKGDMRLT
jgi:hypothetical protein